MNSHDRAPGNRWIYCLSEGKGEPVKIGVSKCVTTRLSQAQSHTWRDMSLMWAVPGDAVVEERLKLALQPCRIRNEWFSDHDDRIKSAFGRSEWRLGMEPWPHKMPLRLAMTRAGAKFRDMGSFGSYEAFCEDKYYKYYNAEDADSIKDLAEYLNVPHLPDELFKARTCDQINSLIASLQEAA